MSKFAFKNLFIQLDLLYDRVQAVLPVGTDFLYQAPPWRKWFHLPSSVVQQFWLAAFQFLPHFLDT